MKFFRRDRTVFNIISIFHQKIKRFYNKYNKFKKLIYVNVTESFFVYMIKMISKDYF